MKKKTRLLSLLVIVALVLSSLSGLAFAKTVVQRRFQSVSNCIAAINVSSSGYATCKGAVVLYDDGIIDATLTLMKSSDKKSWTEVKSWDASDDTNGSITISKGYFVVSGYYYKVVLSADVYDSSNHFIENATVTSKICSY